MGAAQPAGKETASNRIYNLRGWPRADEAEAPGGGTGCRAGAGGRANYREADFSSVRGRTFLGREFPPPQICQKRLGQALPCQEGFSPEGRLVSINTKPFPDLTLKVSDSWHIGPHWSLGDRDISHPSTHAFIHSSIHSYAAMLSAKDIANFLPGSSQEG